MSSPQPQGLPPTILDNSVTLTWVATGTYYGYCTIATAKYEFVNIASFNTLTNSAIAEAITNSAMELQTMIDRHYQMPYTGNNAAILHQLRQMNAKLAMADLYDRFYRGSEPDLSESAAEQRGWVESIITDIADGVINWGLPNGDATPRGMQTVYQISAGIQMTPNPNTLDPNAATPMFSIGTTRFRREMM